MFSYMTSSQSHNFGEIDIADVGSASTTTSCVPGRGFSVTNRVFNLFFIKSSSNFLIQLPRPLQRHSLPQLHVSEKKPVPSR
eukprot:scaffold83_cov246-Pinguiococcus_pyrenoidosus.AAC.17